MKTLDTDSNLHCQLCKTDIEPAENKVVLGAQLYNRQRFFIFHDFCWQLSKLATDPAARRLFAHLGKS